MTKKIRLPYKLERFIAAHTGLIYAEVLRECKDLDGKVLYSKKIIAHSFNANFLQSFYVMLRYGNTLAAFLPSNAPFNSNSTNLDSTGSSAAYGGVPFGLIGSAIDYEGIVLSTDNSITPNALEFITTGRINNGVGGGQLQYLTHASNGLQIIGNTCSLSITRVFLNTSGNDIIVRKVYMSGNVGVEMNYFVEAIPSPFDTIPNTYSYTVTVKFSSTT
jgi:hypothetical protein